ncbi:MAG TPA: class I SAM-dependent rRNA methyltransferase [Candidatus Binatia bacterium]|nr:class I SAM-dependent rRNA methyltransferase [Candidatus Binatia bacterium]
MITVTLKAGREGPVIAGHPWIFSGAIARIVGEGPAGSLAQVVAADGSIAGIGYVNPRCSITVRMLSRQLEDIDADFVYGRLTAALALRRAVVPANATAYRLVNGEGDLLPGLIIDVYGPFIVCQSLTAGADLLKPLVVEGLVRLLSPRGIYEKSEGGVRQEEGLSNAAGVLWGEEPPPLVEIQENDCRFLVNVRGGQKTGFFLDQRENRALLGTVAQGKRILNGFAYTGGFGLVAARNGAEHIISVDSSEAALRGAQKNWRMNNLPEDYGEFVQADMFSYLRQITESFDVVVLDPPPFIRRRQDRKVGITGYKEINLQALRLVAPGGQLFTFSCSQHLSTADFFHTILFAAADARRNVRVLKYLGPAADHPVNLAHPEGTYLKGLWLWLGD